MAIEELPRCSASDEPRVVLAAVARPGAHQARRLVQHLSTAKVMVSAPHAPLLDGVSGAVVTYSGALSGQVARLMQGFDQIVFFLAVGAVVRLIAPHLRSKYEDPGVIAIDDAGRFVVPVLSGHVGGANAFAVRVADLLGATAVITTASDVAGTIAVDILGRDLGWRVEAPKINLKRVAARVVNGEPIAFVQEAGSKAWWKGPGPLPENIRLFDRLDDLDPSLHKDTCGAVLLVTRREIPAELWRRLGERLVAYRPPEDQP